MSNLRDGNPSEPQLDQNGQPVSVDNLDEAQPAPMDDAAGGPTYDPEEEEEAAKLGDFA